MGNKDTSEHYIKGLLAQLERTKTVNRKLLVHIVDLLIENADLRAKHSETEEKENEN